jgi:phosphatidylglycerophosphate synthase
MVALEKEYWFKGKRYGYGWYPASWQGKVLTLAYIVFLLILLLVFPENTVILSIGFLISTVLFFYAAYKKGEKLKWRWGKIDKEH